MPGVSGVTVVTNARATYHYTRGCGRIGRPAFPVPSVLKRATFMHSSGAIRAARSRRHAFSIVMPRFKRGIQYAAMSLMSTNRLWNTGSPGHLIEDTRFALLPVDDARASSLKIKSEHQLLSSRHSLA